MKRSAWLARASVPAGRGGVEEEFRRRREELGLKGRVLRGTMLCSPHEVWAQSLTYAF